MAAATAVGVASTKAQGQNTTSTVTPRMNSPVAAHTAMAQARATPTSQPAHLSASLTTGALFASAASASATMRCSELSPAGLVARISKAPVRLTVPLTSSSPLTLSTGSDSPVMIDWSTVVDPSVSRPSTGMVSPACTRRMSPSTICSTGTTDSSPSRTTRAVLGVSSTSDSMPLRARFAV